MIFIVSIVLMLFNCILIKLMVSNDDQLNQIDSMVTRSIFIFICWMVNWAISTLYLPKYYKSKIDSFLDYHNILVYH